ncbi:hypothetical protein NQ314_013946 [Rhamnusium bicolor]|uniref:Uncharacterized protein n=1 Tax=Rhamnusium bicolor TaxID=1586634 RepID=A0AAV8X4K3_9CUCU|nr:hypothetical protein NQ314_013946 [Rhamnusium bicolor]
MENQHLQRLTKLRKMEKRIVNREENGISKDKKTEDSDDDLVVVEYDEEDPQEGSSSKKRKFNPPEDKLDVDDDVCVIES